MNKTHGLIGLLSLLAVGCQSPSDPDLTQASDALSKMATNSTLTKSCFSVVYPNGEASDFINYLFSDLASAEWPIAMDEMEAEQMKSVRQTPLPNNVVVSPLKRAKTESKEIVLKPDSAERAILVEGYLAGSNTVDFEDRWPLGTAQASDATQQLCQSNIDMGISP